MRWTAGVSDAHVFLRPGTRSVLAVVFAGGSIFDAAFF